MSELLEQMDKEYVLHTYARNYVNFKKGVNATLFDENDKDYIDFTSGIAVCSVGPACMLSPWIGQQQKLSNQSSSVDGGSGNVQNSPFHP